MDPDFFLVRMGGVLAGADGVQAIRCNPIDQDHSDARQVLSEQGHPIPHPGGGGVDRHQHGQGVSFTLDREQFGIRTAAAAEREAQDDGEHGSAEGLVELKGGRTSGCFQGLTSVTNY
jgi:hypothetical protein